jgi:hypothetical protein
MRKKSVYRVYFTHYYFYIFDQVLGPMVMRYKELVARYRSVRRFLPTVLKHIRFGASPCGEPVVKALDYLHLREMKQLDQDAPMAVVSKPWQRHVLLESPALPPIFGIVPGTSVIASGEIGLASFPATI